MTRAFFSGMLAIVGLLVNSRGLFAQATIKGAVCVSPGLPYSYSVIMPEKKMSKTGVGLRIVGGKFIDKKEASVQVMDGDVIRVVWDSGYSSKYLMVDNPRQKAIYPVDILPMLNPGGVEKNTLMKEVAVSKADLALTYSAATGGYCSPEYKYQWQRSYDRIYWSDIPGATEAQYKTPAKAEQAMYYRRAVTELNTSTIAYTEPTAVFIVL